MHKKVLLICFIFLLVGCKKIENSDNYIELVNNCLTDHYVTNDVALGYQFYIPRGVRKLHDYDYNQVFLVDGDYIYLYVDIISYFYKKEMVSESLDGAYYYQSFQFNDKKGYIKILEKEENYFVSIYYHYSKIEVYTTRDKLDKIIALSSIILNSIDYNDTVIERVLDGDLGEFSEFTYEVDKPADASSNFSQYLEEYVQKEDETEQLPLE